MTRAERKVRAEDSIRTTVDEMWAKVKGMPVGTTVGEALGMAERHAMKRQAEVPQSAALFMRALNRFSHELTVQFYAAHPEQVPMPYDELLLEEEVSNAV